MFQIEDVPGKGKGMIAAVDLLPGTEIFSEAEGLLYIPKHCVVQDDIGGAKNGMRAYLQFKKLPEERKRRYLELYCPPAGWFRALIQGFACFTLGGEPKLLSADQDELMRKVAAIFSFNCFPTQDGGKAAFEIASRINHSCYPNCHMHFEGQGCSAMIIRPVKAGEEIMIEYNRKHRFKSIAERRFQCQSGRNFTCRCERCDAPTDEMRQFSCFDATCPGRCYACQSVSDKPLLQGNSGYDGVSFSPPRLLPCTTCKRAAPTEYQKIMFAAEERAVKLSTELLTAFDIDKPSDISTLKALMRKADSLLAALPWHGLSIAVREFRQDWFNKVTAVAVQNGEDCTDAVNLAEAHAKQDQRLIDTLQLAFPCETLEKSLYVAAHAYLDSDDKQDHLRARDLALRGMRMHKKIVGRVYNPLHPGGELEQLLCVTTTAGHVGHTERCGWCEEIPAHAAFKLSLCGRCRRVAYCSEQCQKAHWKGHKKFCKKG